MIYFFKGYIDKENICFCLVNKLVLVNYYQVTKSNKARDRIKVERQVVEHLREYFLIYLFILLLFTFYLIVLSIYFKSFVYIFRTQYQNIFPIATFLRVNRHIHIVSEPSIAYCCVFGTNDSIFHLKESSFSR